MKYSKLLFILFLFFFFIYLFLKIWILEARVRRENGTLIRCASFSCLKNQLHFHKQNCERFWLSLLCWPGHIKYNIVKELILPYSKTQNHDTSSTLPEFIPKIILLIVVFNLYCIFKMSKVWRKSTSSLLLVSTAGKWTKKIH